jgi:signal transduction histidine kinase
MISFLMIGVFANIILERQFKKYVIDKLNQKKEAIVSDIGGFLDARSGNWNVIAIENLGVSALGDGLILRIESETGTVVWDAMKHNEGLCADILQKMAENMTRQYGSFKGGYTENSYTMRSGLKTSTVIIGYYGPYFYSDNDLVFLNTLNKLLLLATGITAVIAIVIGTYTAKRLSGPITRVIRKAEQISEGNFEGKIAEASNTREIVELTEAINTLAEKLGQQEALRKRLTADVAHELRTPIANLQSHLEAMIDGIWEPDTARLKSCHEETSRLTKIVKDLETLARYESEKPVLVPEEVNLTDQLGKVLKLFESEFRTKQISLVTHLTDQPIQADKDKMAQVFTNILSNALKYTPEGGQIEVTVSGDNKTVTVSVKDTGIGIAEEDLPHIFDRFYRADKSRTRNTGGAGIGLAIVKSIVTAHGGSIHVRSQYGNGSEFVICLPRRAEAE